MLTVSNRKRERLAPYDSDLKAFRYKDAVDRVVVYFDFIFELMGRVRALSEPHQDGRPLNFSRHIYGRNKSQCG